MTELAATPPGARAGRRRQASPWARGIRLVPLAPALVGVVGLAVATVLGLLGLGALTRLEAEALRERAALLARTVADRVRATAEGEREEVITGAARRSGAELALVDSAGLVLVDAMVHPLTAEAAHALLVETAGVTHTGAGAAYFAAAPLDARDRGESLLAFIAAPDTPLGARGLVGAIAAFATLLTGVAALVAFALARDAHADVAFVRRRIEAMTTARAGLGARAIPVRSIDAVGVLTDAFNLLAERFSAAEHAYRHDLEAAQRYDRDRGAFLAALSHELRTPLNAILGFTEILLGEVDGPLTEEARENLVIVRRSGEHLRALVDDILDLSALESGRLELHRSEVDVTAIAAEAVREATVLAQAKGLRLDVSGDPVLATVDARRVRQMLGNLLANAIKFTERGSVEVRVTRGATEVVLEVSDTGAGIAEGERALVFEEYRQVGAAETRRLGAGLGLAITRRLAAMHGGRVGVESELGKGSTFTLALPLEPPAPPERSLRSVVVESESRS